MTQALDALRIVASRVNATVPDDWGEVAIWLDRIEEDPRSGWWLHVRDNGVGMTARCLSEYLLDFGTSYWRSPLAASEHPGIHAKAVRHAGVFGIGFFSIFMLGERVRVITRFYGGDSTTNVLELGAGVRERALLREALPKERLNEPGTEVQVLIHGTDTIQADVEAWEECLCSSKRSTGRSVP